MVPYKSNTPIYLGLTGWYWKNDDQTGRKTQGLGLNGLYQEAWT